MARNCKIPKPSPPKVGTIVNKIESIERGTKRKNTSQIPTPLDKAHPKKLKKGDSPRVRKTESMGDRLERLEARQEEMATEQRDRATEQRETS